MTNEQLQTLTEQLSLEFFQKPFQHKAVFNPRLRTTGGRYLLATHHIEINRKYYEVHGLEELKGIIKHELCHYHLHLEGRGYKHRDPEFRELLKKVGAPRHCSPLSEKNQSTGRIYECSRCGYIYIRQRRVNTNRYFCGKCRGKLSEKKSGKVPIFP